MFLKNYQVEEKDFELLFSKFRRVEYAKGEIIIGADRLSDEIFLVESGLTRGYFWDTKGNEVTECFGVSGDLFASMFCYFAVFSLMAGLAFAADADSGKRLDHVFVYAGSEVSSKIIYIYNSDGSLQSMETMMLNNDGVLTNKLARGVWL